MVVLQLSEAKNIFTPEIFGTAQSLSVSDTVEYRGFKSTLLQRFVKCAKPAITMPLALVSVVSLLMRTSFAAATFGDIISESFKTHTQSRL